MKAGIERGSIHMTSIYPEKQIVLETESDVISTRIMDRLRQ